MGSEPAMTPLLSTAKRYHSRIPLISKLPAPVVGVIVAVAVANAAVWAGCGVALHFYRGLMGTAVLSYTLGLRHALDADHISAIDLMTRRLIASGHRPVCVGLFFSLGHSTIVIVTSIAVAATAASLSARFDSFSHIGGIIGSSISSAFLVVLGIMNAYILTKLLKQLSKYLASGTSEFDSQDETVLGVSGAYAGGGCLVRVFGGAFRMIDRSWKMYPLGVLFGLGFDTSSEVALLGIASIQAVKGTGIWVILVFPVLFTAGMCLLDTIDGALMSALYSTSTFSSGKLAVLYYSIILTVITVVVAVVIGVLQILTLVVNVAEPEGAFWRGVEKAGDSYEIIGAAIVGLFVVTAVGSAFAYKPWRRWVEKKRAAVGSTGEETGEETEGAVEGEGVGRGMRKDVRRGEEEDRRDAGGGAGGEC